MWRDISVNLTDLLFSVSGAMDLADPAITDHQVRTAFVAWQMARAADMQYAELERLFVASLLHDIGALSPEEKLGVHTYEDLRPEPHCARGCKLFEESFWLEPAAPIVHWHHTPMAEHRARGRGLDAPNVLSAQILYLADHLERRIDRSRYILDQAAGLTRHIHDLSGEWLADDVVGLFDSISNCEVFWLDLIAKDLNEYLRAGSPLRAVDLDFATVQSLARVFKDMTDFRSRFTASHSCGVAICGRGIAEAMSFTGKDRQQIELAGLLHDIGKLVVPNAILCKPGKLTEAEYSVVRQHSHHTFSVLARVAGMQQIAEWASAHHERLDGSGYCGRLRTADLDLGAKIIAVADVATALAETRPYRAPGDKDTVLAELGAMAANGKLDRAAVTALADHYGEIMSAAAAEQAADERRFAERYAIV